MFHLRKKGLGHWVKHLRNCEPSLTEQNQKSFFQGFEVMRWLHRLEINPEIPTVTNPTESEIEFLDSLWRDFDYKRTNSRLAKGEDHGSKLDDIYEWEDYACERLGMTKEQIHASEKHTCRCNFCLQSKDKDRPEPDTFVSHVSTVLDAME